MKDTVMAFVKQIGFRFLIFRIIFLVMLSYCGMQVKSCWASEKIEERKIEWPRITKNNQIDNVQPNNNDENILRETDQNNNRLNDTDASDTKIFMNEYGPWFMAVLAFTYYFLLKQ